MERYARVATIEEIQIVRADSLTAILYLPTIVPVLGVPAIPVPAVIQGIT